MRFNDLLHLIAFPGKAHGKPPASGFVIATKMPDSRALSKPSDQFQSIHTPVSPEVGNLVNLELLDLGENELSGAIPPELGKLSRLKKLYLYVNELSGGIPPELGSLTSLEEMNLSGNKLTGQIPPELGNLVNLWLLDLGANRLGGKVPWKLAELTNLEELFLGGNDNLTGCIDKALREVQKNDLASLELPFCSDAGPSMSGCTKK